MLSAIVSSLLSGTSRGETRTELANDLGDEGHVLFARAPVDDRGAEGHASAIDGGSEEDATVGDRRLADPTVQIVELGSVFGTRRAESEAHDVERHLRKSLEVRRGLNHPGEVLREVEIVLDDRSVAVATVRAEGRPDRERAGSA